MDAENDYQEFVESLWNTRITNMINESESVITGNETIISNVHYMQPENGVENVEVNNTVQTSNRSNEKIPSQQQLQMSQPLQDITNSQMMRNTSLHQSEVSPYYKDLYARRFIQHTDSGMTGFKRRHLETEIYMSENREEWDSSMYPEELFPKKVSKITEMQTFHPAVNEIIDFKPNSALSAGTNVFLSGYWKKGLVINIENDDSKGKNCRNATVWIVGSTIIKHGFVEARWRPGAAEDGYKYMVAKKKWRKNKTYETTN